MALRFSLRSLLLCLSLGAGAALAVEPALQARAEQLAKLRAEVEELSQRLDSAKEDSRGRLRAVEAQRVDLEVQIRREEIRLERLVAEQEGQRSQLQAPGESDEALAGVVREALAGIRAGIDTGVPFEVEGRREAVHTLLGRLEDKSLTVEQVAARTWALAEDERRLSRENSLDRQVVPIDGEEVLVDTVRIGMIALYARDPNGGLHRATRQDAAWGWVALDGAEAEQVDALFESFTKGVRVGWFELPHLVSEVVP